MSERSFVDSTSNPYAAPDEFLAPEEPLDAESERDRIRIECIDHEASIYALAGILTAVGSALLLMGVAGLLAYAGNPDVLFELYWIPVIFGIIFFAIGLAVATLRKWAQYTVGIAAIPGLLIFPYLTLISGWTLYLLFSTTGQFVFSEEHRAVRRATPHIRCYPPALLRAVLYVVFYSVAIVALTWLSF